MHNILAIASMAHQTGRDWKIPEGRGFLADGKGNYRLFYGKAAPVDGVTRFAVGCDWCDESTGDHYYNKGTATSAVWKKVTTAS